MAAEPPVLTAKKRIEQVLHALVENRAESKVVVFVDDLGHLHAVVASHAFEGMPQRDRQRLVRDYLRDHAAPEDLVYLHRVFALSASEYDEGYSKEVFPGGVSEILRLVEKGDNNANV